MKRRCVGDGAAGAHVFEGPAKIARMDDDQDLWAAMEAYDIGVAGGGDALGPTCAHAAPEVPAAAAAAARRDDSSATLMEQSVESALETGVSAASRSAGASSKTCGAAACATAVALVSCYSSYCSSSGSGGACEGSGETAVVNAEAPAPQAVAQALPAVAPLSRVTLSGAEPPRSVTGSVANFPPSLLNGPQLRIDGATDASAPLEDSRVGGSNLPVIAFQGLISVVIAMICCAAVTKLVLAPLALGSLTVLVFFVGMCAWWALCGPVCHSNTAAVAAEWTRKPQQQRARHSGVPGGSAFAMAASLAANGNFHGARCWRKGAEGEVKTARLFASLLPQWSVQHDIAIPNSRANIDHIATSPFGRTVLIDSKDWATSDPAHIANAVETVMWEVRRYHDMSGKYAEAAIVMHGAYDGPPRVRGVRILHASALHTL
jgi:hypothetical protein